MSSAGLFFAAPEVATSLGHFDVNSTTDHVGSGPIVRCSQQFYKGRCCLTCAAASDALLDAPYGDSELIVRHVEENVQCADGAALRYQLWSTNPPKPEHDWAASTLASGSQRPARNDQPSPRTPIPYGSPKARAMETCELLPGGASGRPSPFRGVVVVIHDFSTDSGRACRNTVPRLLSEGYAVAAYDLRGHGRSSNRLDGTGAPVRMRRYFNPPRRRGSDADEAAAHIEKWRSDLETIVHKTAEDVGVPGVPVFLLGDGFGAAMAIDFVCEASDDLLGDLNICGVAANGAVLNVSRELSFVVQASGATTVADKDFGIFPDEFESLSRDLRVGEMVRTDNLRLKQTSASSLQAAAQLIAGAAEAAESWYKVPLVFFHGMCDVCAPVGAVESFVGKASNPLVSLRKYARARHWLDYEILPERNDFLDHLVDWLDRHR